MVDVQAGCHCCSANILFDEGAQQSFIPQAFAEQLNICAQGSITTAIGGVSTLRTLPSANIELITKSGEEITLSVLIVPKISTPLKMQRVSDPASATLISSRLHIFAKVGFSTSYHSHLRF